MLQAFSDIGPHINMAERQSQQINDALSQPLGGVNGLVAACESTLAPVLADGGASPQVRAAVEQVLVLVRDAVGALERIARPFQHETQMVAEQVDRMYMGFQYQDRISQMMALLEGDMTRLAEALQNPHGQAPSLSEWLADLESRYAMNEQREDHVGRPSGAGTAGPADSETTFF